MNTHCYKTVFSKHLGALVAVGEHAASQGKASGNFAGFADFQRDSNVGTFFLGALTLTCALVSVVWAEPANHALPSGGQVIQGSAAISQSAANMTINQASARAIVNWQSFDIGQNAKVNIVQPNAQSVLLNRVTGAAPSQIFGQMSANGQVVLVNPNGVTFGKDGSVSAAGLTASTLNTTDADFMAGRNRFTRDGSIAQVLNQGTLTAAPGGYVALLGASVSNEGKITAPQGHVALGAAETITLPLSGSSRIKMELTPAAINAAVANQKTGSIITEGGQVYMRAAALGSAMASVLQSGGIDTTGTQGGAVHLLADGGSIKVDGSIAANSSAAGQAGGDIIIGRDAETGVLAKATDVSGAKLESKRGFVETSGDWLATYGTRVSAKDWLLDPTGIEIVAGTTSSLFWNGTTQSSSTILASDIGYNLSQGTNVTIATSAAGDGIAVNESIYKTGGAEATLTLRAHGDISIAANKTITSTSDKLHVLLNSNYSGDGGSIVMSQGSSIVSNGGHITLGGGTVGDGSDSAWGASGSGTNYGILLGGANLISGGGDIRLKGRSDTTEGIYVQGQINATALPNSTGTGKIDLTGRSDGDGGIRLTGAEVTGQTDITLNGEGNNGNGIDISSSSVVKSLDGNIDITATINSKVAHAFSLNGKLELEGPQKSISIHANTMNFNAGAVIDAGSTGTVYLQLADSSNGQNITLGAADDLIYKNLGISNDELNVIRAGTVKVGSLNDNAPLIVDSDIVTRHTTGNIVLQTGGSISLNKNLTIGDDINTPTIEYSKNLTLHSAQANSTVDNGTNTIKANGLELLGTSTAYVLASPDNDIQKLAGNTGSVILQNSTGLAIDTVNTAGLSTTRNMWIKALDGDITIKQNLSAVATSAGATVDVSVYAMKGAIVFDAAAPFLPVDPLVGVITADTLQLYAGTYIGDSNKRIQTSVNHLTLLATNDIYVTEKDAVTVAAKSNVNNDLGISSNIDIQTQTGTLTVGHGRSINDAMFSGISANGTGQVTLTGGTNDSSGVGVDIQQTITAGGNITIEGRSSDAAGVSVALNQGIYTTTDKQFGPAEVRIKGVTAGMAAGVAVYGEVQPYRNSSLTVEGTSTGGGVGIYTHHAFGPDHSEFSTSTLANGNGTLGNQATGAVTLVGTSTGGVDDAWGTPTGLNQGYGLLLRGSITSNQSISITGSADHRPGVFIQHGPLENNNEWSEKYIQPTIMVQPRSEDQTMTGDAIYIKGNNVLGSTSNPNGVLIAGAQINNNSYGGATKIESERGGITAIHGVFQAAQSASDVDNYFNSSIYNGPNAGAVNVIAGTDTDTDSAASIGEQKPENLSGAGFDPLWAFSSVMKITQTSSAGVKVQTTGKGNISGLEVKNEGKGNVVIAAGSTLPADMNGLGGQVKSNQVTQSGSGKTLIFSGNLADTGPLENIDGSLGVLYASQVDDNLRNLTSYQAYSDSYSIPNGAPVQAIFRQGIDLGKVDFSHTLNKTYGDAGYTKSDLKTGNRSQVLADAREALAAMPGDSMSITTSSGQTIHFKKSTLVQQMEVGSWQWNSNNFYSSSGNLSAYDEPRQYDLVNNVNTSGFIVNYHDTKAFLAVNKKALTGSIAMGQSTYGAALNAGQVSLTNVLNGDDVTPGTVGFNTFGKTSSSWNLKASDTAHSGVQILTGLYGPDANNYSFAEVKGDYKVDRLALTGATIAGVNTTYGTPAATGEVSFDNIQGPVVSKDKVTATATLVDAANSTSGKLKAGSYKQTANAISGDDSDNYSFNNGFTTTDKNYVVGKLTLDGAAIAGVNTTYATAADTGAVSFTNVQGSGPTKDKVGATASLVDSATSTSGNLKAGSYKQMANAISGDDSDNYSFNNGFTTTDKNYVVGKLALDGAVIAGVNTTYATAADTGAVSFTNVQGSGPTKDKVGATASLVDSATSTSGNLKAGSYKQMANAISGDDSDNYSFNNGFTTGTSNYHVDKKTLIVSGITASDKTYNGDAVASVVNTGLIKDGLVGLDDVAVSTTGAFRNDANTADDKNVKLVNGVVAAKMVALSSSYDGTDKDNYVITDQTSTTAKITKSANTVTLTANSDTSKVYNGTTQSVSGFVVTGLVGDDAANSAAAVAGISAGASGKNAGSYTSTFTGSNTDLANNYANITKSDGTLTIAQNTTANVVLAANSDTSKVYNGTTQSVSGFAVSGLVGDDAVNSAAAVAGISAGAFGKNAGSYTSTFTGSNTDLANNYANITKADGTLTIAKNTTANVVLAANSDTSKVYDGTTQSVSGFAVTGLVGDDAANATNTAAAVAGISAGASGKNAGSYTSTFTGSNADLANNYANITKSDGTLTIAKNTTANVVLTANSDTSKVYNGTTQSVSGFAVAGLVGDDAANSAAAVAGITAGASGKNAGSYTSTFTGSNTDLANNYANITKADGTLTIAKNTTANVVLAANSDTSKVYDGTTQSVSGFAVSGLVGEDAANSAAAVAGISAGASGKNAGSYTSTFTGSNADLANNYANITQTHGTLTIAKVDLLATLANQTKTYDGTTVATLVPGVFSVKGVTISGQTESATVNQTVAFYDDRNVLSASSVTANLAVGNFAAATGTDLNNYNLPTSVSAKGTITTKDAAVTGRATLRQANGALQSQLPALTSGFANGEDVMVTGLATGVTPGVYTSNLKLVPASAQTILSNYKLSINNALLTINPAITSNAPVVIEPRHFVTPISRLTLAGFNNGITGAAVATYSKASNEQRCTPESSQECSCEFSDPDLSIEFCIDPKPSRELAFRR